MEKLLLILTYFLTSMFLASCSNDCDTCELPPPKFGNFDIDRFTEKPWHLYSITPPTFADNWTCWTNTVYKSHNGCYYMHASFTDKSSCEPGQITVAVQVKKENIIEMEFLGNPQWNYPYYVYDTDYKSYLVQGGCPEAFGGKTSIAISYTSWYPTKTAQKAVQCVLKKYGFDQYEYARVCNNIPEEQ